MVACLAFLGFCNIYMLRVNLSVAIVAMTSGHKFKMQNESVVAEGERKTMKLSTMIMEVGSERR